MVENPLFMYLRGNSEVDIPNNVSRESLVENRESDF